MAPREWTCSARRAGAGAAGRCDGARAGAADDAAAAADAGAGHLMKSTGTRTQYRELWRRESRWGNEIASGLFMAAGGQALRGCCRQCCCCTDANASAVLDAAHWGVGGKGAPDDRATNGGEAEGCAACARVRAALRCCGCSGGRLRWRGAADAGQVIVSCGGVGQAKRARPPAAVDDKAMVAV